MRSIDPCDRIGCSRTGRHIDSSHSVGYPEITLGCHRTGLLMMAIDFLDSTVPSKGIVEMHRSSPRYHEDMANCVGSKSLNYVVCKSHENIRLQRRFLFLKDYVAVEFSNRLKVLKHACGILRLWIVGLYPCSAVYRKKHQLS